jgi:hypothetical protein
MYRLLAWDTGTGAFERLRWGTMKNDSLRRGTLVVAFTIGAGWIGYMGWPLNGLITRAAEQSNSPNRSQASAVFQDSNCPGNDNHALMCRLVNEYRASTVSNPSIWMVWSHPGAGFWFSVEFDPLCWIGRTTR